MTHNEYNGWTNYETWLVKLWMDNDEGEHRLYCSMAQDAYDNADEDPPFSKLERAQLDLSTNIKEAHEAILEEQTPSSGFIADLVNAAMSEVNWHEIACSLIEDNVEVEEKETVD